MALGDGDKKVSGFDAYDWKFFEREQDRLRSNGQFSAADKPVACWKCNDRASIKHVQHFWTVKRQSGRGEVMSVECPGCDEKPEVKIELGEWRYAR